jgi:hypothetical protein
MPDEDSVWIETCSCTKWCSFWNRVVFQLCVLFLFYMIKYYIFWVWICSLFSMQFACAILSSVSCRNLPYFSTLSLIYGTIFDKKLLSTKCVLNFYTTFVRNIFYSKNWARCYHKCVVNNENCVFVKKKKKNTRY